MMGKFARNFMAGQGAAQDNEPRVFDFDEAVAQARRDYPEETKNVLFLDSSAPDFYQKATALAKEICLNQYQINSLFKNAEKGTAVATEMNGFQIALVPASRAAEKGQFPGDQYKSSYFCFQHELGHFVVPNAHTSSSNKDVNWREHAADFFAITRGIQAGVFDKKDVVDQATTRGMASLLALCDTEHLTSMSLDAIAINPKNIDFLSLSKQDIKKIAQQHAGAFEMDSKTESQFAEIFRSTEKATRDLPDDEYQAVMVKLRLQALVELCEKAPANSQAFYLSARILDKLIDMGEAKTGTTKVGIDISTPGWQKVKEMIGKKAGDRDIGAKKSLESAGFTRQEEQPKGMVSLIRDKLTPLKI